MKRFILLALTLFSVAFVPSVTIANRTIALSTVSTTPAYIITDLGTLGGNAGEAKSINNAGDVTGYSFTSSGENFAFLYRNGQMQNLGKLGNYGSNANAINNNGDVVGSSTNLSGSHHAFLKPYNQPMQDLGSLNFLGSYGLGINDNADVVGQLYSHSGSRAFLKLHNGQIQNLGTLPGGNRSFAIAINNNGDIAGYSTNSTGFEHAFLYRNGSMLDLGTLPNHVRTYAYGINNNGDVVGYSADSNGFSRAFLYRNGQMQNLGTLGGNYSQAEAINNNGDIVGHSQNSTGQNKAFIYGNGQMQNLNNLIPANSGWELVYAKDINDSGQIVGWGYRNYQARLFLLTPTETSVADGDVAGLIKAINDANAKPGADVINLAQGSTYNLTTVNNVANWEGQNGLPVIKSGSTITINGNGATIQRSSAEGTPAFRLFYNYGDLTLNGVTIKGGKSAQTYFGHIGGGGGIKNQGKLQVLNSTITENSGSNQGSSEDGGGILNYGGTLTVVNSTISHNTGWGGYGGGGILNMSYPAKATTTISNSTIYENKMNDGSSPGRGDAVADAFGTAGSVTIKNSIVTSPTKGLGNDCYSEQMSGGFMTKVSQSLGHNISGDTSCGLTGNGDKVVANLQLGSLANNGGRTPTHALLLGNSAVDAIPVADCTTAAGVAIREDQRGITRPKGAGCDIGSYELSDVTAPILSLPNALNVEATGSSGMVVNYSASATDDVDGNVAVNCSPASGSIFAYGTTSVTCTATDQSGNTASGSFNVTVADTTAPVISNMPSNKTVEATGANGSVVTWANPTATDIVSGNVEVTCSPASGSTFELGTNTVTCTATDAHDNSSSASFTVTVQDTTAPTINNVPANQTLEATSAAGATATWTNPTAMDVVNGNRDVTCTPASGDTFAIGMTTVQCSATDATGNTNTHSFTVTVQDTTAPSLSLPANQTLYTATNSASFDWTATATDVVSVNVPVICSSASPATFSLGTTTVSCSATDAAGNTANGSFNVTVLDNAVPTITINAPTATNYTLGQSVTANFNCDDAGSGIASCTGTVANSAVIDTATVGTKTFTVIATDNSQNQSSQIVTYTVGYGIVALFDQTKAHNSGSNIPIKLRIVDANGADHSSQSIVITALRVEPGNLPADSPGNSNPTNVFSYSSSSQSYQYNLKTDKEWSPGTYQLIFRIAGDPVEHSVSFIVR